MKTYQEYQEKVKRIKKKITKLHEQLYSIQDQCKHEDKDITHYKRGSYATGDIYTLVEYKCNICSKVWVEEKEFE